MIIFVVFGMITCWCGCWILFCPNFCRENQEQTGLMIWRRHTSKMLSNDTLLCPAGHGMRLIVSKGKGRCIRCMKEQFIEDDKVYACLKCDWKVCYSCYRQGTACSSTAPSGEKFQTPKNKQKRVVVSGAIREEEKPTPETRFTRISKNVVRSVSQIPEHIMGKTDVTRTAVITEREKSRRSMPMTDRGYGFRSDYQYYSPYRKQSDYQYYSPYRREKSGRYRDWSDYTSSTQSENIEYSPKRRPWRSPKRKRRREYD